MSDANRNGTILIEEGATLPPRLSIKSDPFLPGWRILKSPDRAALTRGIEGANWNFFYQAGETRATVLGRDSLATLRRAVKRVFAKQEQENFNSRELTKVVSKWFLGIPFLRVVAHSRHIQESNALLPAKVFALKPPGALAPDPRNLVPTLPDLLSPATSTFSSIPNDSTPKRNLPSREPRNSRNKTHRKQKPTVRKEKSTTSN